MAETAANVRQTIGHLMTQARQKSQPRVGHCEDSLWRRDLSALGPFGAEANFLNPIPSPTPSPAGSSFEGAEI